MLKTEMRNPLTMHIDKADTNEILQMIQNENHNAVNAVGNVISEIAAACDAIIAGMNKGGRLIYIGAGTSGRLAIIDAAECPPTFGVGPERVMGLIAGGHECMFRAAEADEDDGDAGIRDIKSCDLSKSDSVVGISASGNAVYVAEALKYAKTIGCTTIGLTSNHNTLLTNIADIAIVTDTGAEVITGSTRMKAGTAQKLVLNMLSTTAMIKTGMVYENLMINLKAKNEKLTRRMITIISEITGCGRDEAQKMLEDNDCVIRKALEDKRNNHNL